MKLLTSMTFILLICVSAFTQYLPSVNFIDQLDDKKIATYEDAVAFFMIEIGIPPAGFEYNKIILDRTGITKGMTYLKNTPLRRGMISLMIARHLKIKDSLFFLISGSERYAFRACAAFGIMDENNSEWDPLSGEELIEIMSRLSAQGVDK
jgi:hypothetical protein